MVFFQQSPDSPLPEPGASSASDEGARPKNAPLFKQDSGLPASLSGQHISLSAYISRHLGENAEPAAPEASPEPPSRKTFQNPAFTAGRKPLSPTGQYLNRLDVEMPGGLEQYLPTLSFRLRVVKKRLDGEILELREQLRLYENLTQLTPVLQERRAAVQAQLTALERHERTIRAQLSTAMSVGHWWYRLTQEQGKLGRECVRPFARMGRWIAGLAYGKAFLKKAAAGRDLRSLHQLFARRMQDQTLSSEELGHLLTRYEQVARQLEKLDAPTRKQP